MNLDLLELFSKGGHESTLFNVSLPTEAATNWALYSNVTITVRVDTLEVSCAVLWNRAVKDVMTQAFSNLVYLKCINSILTKEY